MTNIEIDRLLTEAKNNYPFDTKFKGIKDGEIHTVKGIPYYNHQVVQNLRDFRIINVATEIGGHKSIYLNEEWAKIIK